MLIEKADTPELSILKTNQFKIKMRLKGDLLSIKEEIPLD